jgi:transposase
MRTHEKVSHVGMDSHRTFSRLTARDADNHVVLRQRLEHDDRQKMRKQLQRFAPGTPVILEGTFGWGWLADELQDAKLDPHLCHCRKVSAWREARGTAKTNTLDADLISELWRERPRWWEVWLAPQSVRDQREWLRYRMALVQIHSQTKLRVHATLHRHGVLHDFSDLFGKKGRAFLKQLVEADEPLRHSARQTLAGYLQLLQQVRLQIAQVTRELRRQVRADPQARRWDTLPGIGWVLSYTICAEIGDIRRFPSERALAKYALLAPLADDSGEEDGSVPIGRHVGHIGRRTLKWAFIEAAHSAVLKSPRSKAIYDRRTNGGKKDRNRGFIAVARHLCKVGYVCLTKGVDYTEQRPPRPGELPVQASSATAAQTRPELGQPDLYLTGSKKRRQRRTGDASTQACL